MGDLSLATVQLQDQAAALQASFVPGTGMLCSSLRHRGEELLAENAGVEAYARDGKTMGIPLLYPWANRLAGFQYSVAGRTVHVPRDATRVAVDQNGLPIHGVIGGRLAWELIPEPATDMRSLAARLQWSDDQPELFEAFPFRHELDFRARLEHGDLEIELTVTACGTDVVPLAFGFHPYLAPPGAARESWLIDLPAMRRLELDADQIPTGAGAAQPGRRFELAELEFDDGFDDVSSPARFSVTGAGRRIELELLEGYPFAQVFAPRTGQFICFEPMAAPTNALASGEGLKLLDPGERYTAGFSVSVQDLDFAGDLDSAQYLSRDG
jgi:galactose mutarotase-like enzyme